MTLGGDGEMEDVRFGAVSSINFACQLRIRRLWFADLPILVAFRMLIDRSDSDLEGVKVWLN
jgi:hypothetical protein